MMSHLRCRAGGWAAAAILIAVCGCSSSPASRGAGAGTGGAGCGTGGMCPIRNVDVLATTVSGTISLDVNGAATNADSSWGLAEVGLVNGAGDEAVLAQLVQLPAQG